MGRRKVQDLAADDSPEGGDEDVAERLHPGVRRPPHVIRVGRARRARPRGRRQATHTADHRGRRPADAHQDGVGDVQPTAREGGDVHARRRHPHHAAADSEAAQHQGV